MKIQDNIAIVTTVYNWELYKSTSRSFPPDMHTYAIDGSKGFYGLRSLLFALKKLKHHNYKYLIMVDEDAVFSSIEKLFSLMKYMAANNFVACGMRDGGALKWRNKNPHSINTFFAVLNLEEIYKVYEPKEVKKNQYVKFGEFLHNLENVQYHNYDKNSLFEEYYCFFFWLLRKNKKILYLKAENPFNNETTAVLNHNDETFLYHAWYSRFYGKNEEHTKRINEMINMAEMNQHNSSPILLKNPSYKLRYLAYKYYRRFLRKIRLTKAYEGIYH